MAGRGSVYGRSKPVFQPVNQSLLTDDERRRLERIAALYPFLEFTDRRGMNYLRFLRWQFRNGDNNA